MEVGSSVPEDGLSLLRGVSVTSFFWEEGGGVGAPSP